MRGPDEIVEALQNIFFDIKAEALIGDLMEDGLNSDKFITIPDGTFKRRYSRDVGYSENIKLENGQNILGIHLNRDGLYDSLPEGLFHEKTEAASKQTSGSSGESKKLKAEEKAARKFFLPFENEIFLQGIQLELEERNILGRFAENLFDDIYPEFWNLDKSLDRKYVSRMILLLHLSHLIVGNLSLTAKCLEAVIEEKVSINIRQMKHSQKNYNEDVVASIKNNSLGFIELGTDFICGDNFESWKPIVELHIGPLKNTKIVDYLENGSVSKFIDCFCEYFVPAELDVVTDILVAHEKQQFSLNEEEEGAVLGYITVI